MKKAVRRHFLRREELRKKNWSGVHVNWHQLTPLWNYFLISLRCHWRNLVEIFVKGKKLVFHSCTLQWKNEFGWPCQERVNTGRWKEGSSIFFFFFFCIRKSSLHGKSLRETFFQRLQLEMQWTAFTETGVSQKGQNSYTHFIQSFFFFFSSSMSHRKT